MKSWTKPTNDLIGKALASVKKEIDRRYFFSRLKNPQWLQPLVERDYFKSPPRVRDLPDGSTQFPFWPELQYLKNVSGHVPDEVVRVVLDIPEVDNPRVYQDVLEIALNLPGTQSAMLKPKMLEFAEMEPRSLLHIYPGFQDLLIHWTEEDQISAALDLCEVLVQFEPDPQSEAKRKRRKEDPNDWTTRLEPAPRFDEWDYEEILTRGVRPLAEKVPYQVASILIDAVAEMITLGRHPEDGNDEDYSEIWYPRLDSDGDGYARVNEALVHALAFACVRVFEEDQDSVAALDGSLRNQRWKIFTRLRQHLYALHPNELTKPWIRDFILAHDDYAKSEHHYEFQRMVRCTCDYFGAGLLTEVERTQIFDAILGGPSKERFREWMGEQFTEGKFEQRQRYFHRMQLRPFATVLFGKYASYLRELEGECDAEISDEEYSPKSEGGSVTRRSPRSPEDLRKFDDAELLSFINDWQDERRDEDDWLVEINIEALAEGFQAVFKESIIQDPERLRFWIENRDCVERPIYVRAMISGMEEEIKARDFSRLSQWLQFCEWVLRHPDQGIGDGPWRRDQSRDDPNWHDSRRAVGDFVGTCLDKEVDVPISAQGQLAELLDTVCTQFDSRLDQGQHVLGNQDEPLAEAINNTRSRALEDLVNFGLWLRRKDPEADVSSVTTILEKRFDPSAEHRLTTPEYAILARNYVRVLSLNLAWATEHESDFFPKDVRPDAWSVAFAHLLISTRPNRPAFEILRDDFQFALEHISDFQGQELLGRESGDVLGQHLFIYYLWDVYPLHGEDSPLEAYYEQTIEDRKHWAELFSYVGRQLNNSGKNLNAALKDRATAFFDWRLQAEEPTELREFMFWLKAECLDANWRLKACSRVTDICSANGVDIKIPQGVLPQMLPENTGKVVECFAKLIRADNSAVVYMRTDDVRAILRAGLESRDDNVRQNAEGAREELLRKGRFDLLNLDD